MQIVCIGLTVVLAKQLYHDSFRLSRKQVFHKCVDSCAQFVNQNGLNSQLAIILGASQRSNLNSKYLGGKYPDSFI